MNEESVGNVMAYFNDLRDQRANAMGVPHSNNIGHSATMG